MKQLLLITFFGLMFGQSLIAQTSIIKRYIEQYKATALKYEREYGVPASITLAQGILESAAGTSRLAQASNNHFGIKRGYDWYGPVVYFWDDDVQKSAFRKYSSIEESYRDHAKFLRSNSRYRDLFNKSVFDYRGWANGLQMMGYATSPTYAQALIGYIDSYQLYAINGGVKLRPGRKNVITKTITIEELVEDTDTSMDDEEQSEEETEVAATVSRFDYVVEKNEVRCTMLYPGETLSSIAQKYNIPKSRILEFNESTDEKDFKEGDIIFLQKKRKKYSGAQDIYRVKEGDSLYMISQHYGIRMASLCKMNNVSVLTVLKEGQKIKLK